MDVIFLHVSIYVETDQRLNMKDWEAGFGPQAAFENAWSIVSLNEEVL